jgi:carbamoyl-phosphate synthase large subunit
MEMKVDQLGLIKSPSPREASTLPRVLVAGAGGPSGVAAIKALDGETLDIFSADIDPNAPGLNLVDENRRLPVAKGHGDSYTELLFELCEEQRIDVLVPAVGCELLLLASARAFFAEIGTRIVLPSEKTLRVCLDRQALRRCCRGVVRVSDSRLADENPRLADENQPGVEYSLAILAGSDGEVIAVVPWAQVDSGTAASERIVRDEKLEKIGCQLAARVGLTSLANIQMKEASDGELVLLEVNPYFTGAMPPPAASSVSMLKLCVEGVLSDD